MLHVLNTPFASPYVVNKKQSFLRFINWCVGAAISGDLVEFDVRQRLYDIIQPALKDTIKSPKRSIDVVVDFIQTVSKAYGRILSN